MKLLAHLLHLANSRPPIVDQRGFFALKDRLLKRHATRLERDHIQEIKKDCWGPRELGYCPGKSGRWCERCGGTGVWDHFFVRLAVYDWAGYRFHRPVERPCRPTAAPDIKGYVEHRDRGRLAGEARLWLYLLVGERGMLAKELRAGCTSSPGWWPMLRLQKTAFVIRHDLLPRKCIHCGWPCWPKGHPPQHRDCLYRRLRRDRQYWQGDWGEDDDIPF